MSGAPLIVIGAGPAGCSAAIAAAQAGLPVTLIDEHRQPGGQIYRQAPAAFAADQNKPHTSQPNRGDLLRRRLDELSDKITTRFSTRVWGVFGKRGEHRLGLLHDGRSRFLEAQRLIFAPGAYEFTPPFPGWTLPGVMTPGGAQSMVKTMHVLPGRRALVVGTGPFLLVVANCLHDAKVEVVGVVEAVRRREVISVLPRLASGGGLLWEGWRHLRRLRAAGIPLFTGRIILQAAGEQEVSQAVIAPCDSAWRPDLSRSRRLDVDTLCVGYGFIPRTELSQLAGCQMVYENELGGWRPQVDPFGRTSVRTIWSAGDGAGVAGALVAELEGALAGTAAAHDAGALNEQRLHELSRPIQRKLSRLRRFRSALDRLSRIRPGLAALAGDDTVVCRCEELTLAELKAGIDAGNKTLRSLKVATRLGMGLCQGRMCWPGVSRIIATAEGGPKPIEEQIEKQIEELGPLSVRPPIFPVTLGELGDDASQT